MDINDLQHIIDEYRDQKVRSLERCISRSIESGNYREEVADHINDLQIRLEYLQEGSESDTIGREARRLLLRTGIGLTDEGFVIFRGRLRIAMEQVIVQEMRMWQGETPEFKTQQSICTEDIGGQPADLSDLPTMTVQLLPIDVQPLRFTCPRHHLRIRIEEIGKEQGTVLEVGKKAFFRALGVWLCGKDGLAYDRKRVSKEDRRPVKRHTPSGLRPVPFSPLFDVKNQADAFELSIHLQTGAMEKHIDREEIFVEGIGYTVVRLVAVEFEFCPVEVVEIAQRIRSDLDFVKITKTMMEMYNAGKSH